MNVDTGSVSNMYSSTASNLNSPVVSSVTVNSSSVAPITRTKRIIGRPFKKGNPGGPGKPKDSVSLKTSLKQLLTKSSSDEIIGTLIDMAKSGSIQHTKLIAELTGDVSNGSPQVNIGHATLVSTELIDAARAFLIQKNTYTNQIVDVTPISSSIQ
jgi:hypothetical protein